MCACIYILTVTYIFELIYMSIKTYYYKIFLCKVSHNYEFKIKYYIYNSTIEIIILE